MTTALEEIEPLDDGNLAEDSREITTEAETSGKGQKIVAVIFASFTLLVDTALCGTLLVNFEDILQIRYESESDILKTELFNTVKWFVQAIISAFAGILIRKFGALQIPLALGFGMLFLATLIFGTEQGYSLYMVGAVIHGCGAALATVCSLALVAQRLKNDPKERRTAFAVIVAVAGFSYEIAHPLSHMQKLVGRAAPFRAFSVICFVMVLAIFCASSLERRWVAEDKPTTNFNWRPLLCPGVGICALTLIEQPIISVATQLLLELSIALKVISITIGAIIATILLLLSATHHPHSWLPLTATGVALQISAWLGHLPPIRRWLSAQTLTLLPLCVHYCGVGVVRSTLLQVFAEVGGGAVGRTYALFGVFLASAHTVRHLLRAVVRSSVRSLVVLPLAGIYALVLVVVFVVVKRRAVV